MCYKIRTHESPMAAPRHLLLMLHLRSLHARNRGGFAGSSCHLQACLQIQQLQALPQLVDGRFDASELPARSSWGTRWPPEPPNPQQQLLQLIQLELLLQCCAKVLQHHRAADGDVHAVDREQHRDAVERRRSRGPTSSGAAAPRPAQRSRQPAWQASNPAFCGTGGGYMRTYLACISRYAHVPWRGDGHRPRRNRRPHTHGSRTPPRVAHHTRSGRASVSDLP